MIKTINRFSIIALSALLFTACIEPKVDMPNKSEIHKANTDYSNTLENINSMIATFHNGKPMIVVVTPIQDRTASKGKVPQDITDIVKTSFNKIGNSVTTLFNYNGSKDKRQVYIINGAITEFDVIQATESGVSAAIEVGNRNQRANADGGLKDGSKITKLALNFNPANPKTGAYIPRTSTSNKITIYQKKSANEFAFSILGSGFGFSNGVTKTQGLHSSITVLAELSVAEVLGKLGKFPYWVLTKGKADPDVFSYLSKTFLRDSIALKIKKVSYLLSLHGYNIQPSSVMTPSLKEAIIQYKSKKSLEVNGFITKKLYLSLLEN